MSDKFEADLMWWLQNGKPIGWEKDLRPAMYIDDGTDYARMS